MTNDLSLFVSPEKQDFQLSNKSPAINSGRLDLLNVVQYDILGNTRDYMPDIGAYEKLD